MYTNHSGGATGADIAWETIGLEYGVINHNHYYLKKKTPFGNLEISYEDAIEGQNKVTIAARQLGRIEKTYQVKHELLIRNWCQVKYSEAIYAITTFLLPNSILSNGRTAKIHQGAGGTGYAIQMGINENKPVYLFDQEINQWLKYTRGVWEDSKVPILTKNFAGIGTREINETGLKAIRNVYENTFKK